MRRLTIAVDAESAAADRRPAQRGDDAIGHRRCDIHEREPIGDLNRPDSTAANARLVRDCADEIARAHPRLAATTDNEPNPGRIVVASPGD
jgi:hypothetical protein